MHENQEVKENKKGNNKNKNILLILLSILGVLVILGIFGFSYWQNSREKTKEKAEGVQGETIKENKEKAEIKKEEVNKGNENESQETVDNTEQKKATEEKTKDWQSYENKEYKYKVKYPKDWFTGPENKEDSWIIHFMNKKVEREEEIDTLDGVKVEILVQGNPRNLSLDDWVKEGHMFSGEPKNSQKIDISGISAVKEEVDFEGMNTTVYFFRDSDVFTISYSGVEGDYNKNKGVFDLILESLELTK